MLYSNEYDAIPICRTHARTEPVRTPKFSSDHASDKRQFCRLSLALSLPIGCVHTLICLMTNTKKVFLIRLMTNTKKVFLIRLMANTKKVFLIRLMTKIKSLLR